MNIFVAGVHGVGKTYLASRLPDAFGLLHTSASKLIREERAMPNWGVDKRVSDIDGNQIALAAAVKRYNTSGTRLLLDGHFVLLDPDGEFQPLGTNVFCLLSLQGAVLLEDAPATILGRIRERDDREVNIGSIAEFIATEHAQAQAVCKELRIPLHVLHAPAPAMFAEVITELLHVRR